VVDRTDHAQAPLRLTRPLRGSLGSLGSKQEGGRNAPVVRVSTDDLVMTGDWPEDVVVTSNGNGVANLSRYQPLPVSMPTLLNANLGSVMDPASCSVIPKKVGHLHPSTDSTEGSRLTRLPVKYILQLSPGSVGVGIAQLTPLTVPSGRGHLTLTTLTEAARRRPRRRTWCARWARRRARCRSWWTC
jgi:hypothetical protein